jgi:hypothetical protein
VLNFEWRRELFVWEGEALNTFIAVCGNGEQRRGI